MLFARSFGIVLAMMAVLAGPALLHPALAADAVFPPGSRVGLVPPAGLVPSRSFKGFEDKDTKSGILIVELPQAAFAELEKTTTPEVLKREGVTIDKREPMTIAKGKAIVFIGKQEANGANFRKWFVLASSGDLTIVMTVQIPDAAKAVYTDPIIRNALESITIRPEPLQEKIGLLPFKIDALAGFHVIQAEGNTAVLTDGPKKEVEVFNQSFMLISINNGAPAQPSERAEFSRQSLASLPGFKDFRVTFSEPIRINSQAGYEIRADAKHAKTEADVTIVQWIRFGPGGHIRIVGVVPKADWAKIFPRLREVRDSIDPR